MPSDLLTRIRAVRNSELSKPTALMDRIRAVRAQANPATPAGLNPVTPSPLYGEYRLGVHDAPDEDAHGQPLPGANPYAFSGPIGRPTMGPTAPADEVNQYGLPPVFQGPDPQLTPNAVGVPTSPLGTYPTPTVHMPEQTWLQTARQQLGNAATQALVGTEEGWNRIVNFARGSNLPPEPASIVHGALGLTPEDQQQMAVSAEEIGQSHPLATFAANVAAMPLSMAEPAGLAAMIVAGPMGKMGMLAAAPALETVAAKFGPRVAGMVEAELRHTVGGGAIGGTLAAAHGATLDSPQGVQALTSGVLEGGAMGAVGGPLMDLPRVLARSRAVPPAPTPGSAAIDPAGTPAGSPPPASGTQRAGVGPESLTTVRPDVPRVPPLSFQEGAEAVRRAQPAGTVEDVRAFAAKQQQMEAVRAALKSVENSIAQLVGVPGGTPMDRVAGRDVPARPIEPGPAESVLREIQRGREANSSAVVSGRATGPRLADEIGGVADRVAEPGAGAALDARVQALVGDDGAPTGEKPGDVADPRARAAQVNDTPDPARGVPPESPRTQEPTNGEQEEGQGRQGLLSPPPGTQNAPAPTDTSGAGVTETPTPARVFTMADPIKDLRAAAAERGIGAKGSKRALVEALNARGTPGRDAVGSVAPGPSRSEATSGPATGRVDPSATEASAESTPATGAKEPWQMTRDEYARDMAVKSYANSPLRSKNEISDYERYWSRRHADRVQEALAEGKPVPPEVLADYPELAKAATDFNLPAPKLKSPTENASKVERPVEPKSREQRLLDLAERERAERQKRAIERSSKPGQRPGATTLFDDVVSLAVEYAARAGAAGIKAGKALREYVREQMGKDASEGDVRRVTGIAGAVLRDSVKDGVLDTDTFQAVTRAVRSVADRTRTSVETDAQTITAGRDRMAIQVERAQARGETAAAKAGDAGFKEGFTAGKAVESQRAVMEAVKVAERARRAQAREDRETGRRELRLLADQLTDARKRGASMAAIEKRGTVDAARAGERAKAGSDKALRDEAVRLIEEHAPPADRGRYLRAANDATTLHRVGQLVERLRRDMETREMRRGLQAADRAIGSKTDSLELDTELRDVLHRAVGTVEQIKRRLRSEFGPPRSAKALRGAAGADVPVKMTGPTADEIAVLRDDLSNAINAILGVRHEQKTLDRVRVKGEEVEASAIRQEVSERVAGRGEIPAGDIPNARDRGFLRRAIARRTNLRTMMTALDGGKPGGPGRRIFGKMLDARSRSLAMQHTFEDGLSSIVTKHGYTSLGHWLAEWGGTLNKGAQKTVDVAFGPFKKLTMDQAAYLYASWGDEGFRARIRSGQEIQFRDAATEKPIRVTPADFDRVANALPENVRKIIDESKALYDRIYFQRLSNVNKRMRGYHLDKTDGYFGIKLNRSFTEGRGTPQSWRRAFIRSLEESGFMQEREGPSKSPILIGDFSHDIVGRSRAAATTIGKAETVKLLTRVFLHPDTVPELTAMFGKSFVERMERRISLWSGGDAPRPPSDSAFRTVLGLWARGKTQLWVPTWARNLVGGAVRLMDVLPASSVLRSLAGVTPERFRELRAYSPEMRERFDAGGLGAFTHGTHGGAASGLRPAAAAHLKDGLRGTLAGLAETVGAMATLRPGEAGEALRGVGRSWESFLDAMSIGNFFDGASAMMAYDHFLRSAPAKYLGEGRKRWAARNAARAFERVSNTATIEYANDVQLDARESGLVAMLTPFTGDTAKAQSMIAEAAMNGTLGRTAAVLAAGALASGGISALWAAAKGEKTDDAATSGATRVGQELVSLIPGVGNVANNLIPVATGKAQRDAAALETPLTSLATDAIQGGADVLRGLKAMDERSATRREKYEALALRGFSRLADTAGSAIGAPTAYVPFASKAYANWSGKQESDAAAIVSRYNTGTGRTGEQATQKRDARADLWLAIKRNDPAAAALAIEDMTNAKSRLTLGAVKDLIESRHPLASVPMHERAKFRASLSADERKAIDDAIREHREAATRAGRVIAAARSKITASR